MTYSFKEEDCLNKGGTIVMPVMNHYLDASLRDVLRNFVVKKENSSRILGKKREVGYKQRGNSLWTSRLNFKRP